MKKWVLQYLRCPECYSLLNEDIFENNEKGEILTGVLICANSQCQTWYPIIRAIPRLLKKSLREDLTIKFVNQYKEKMVENGCIENNDNLKKDELLALKKHTIQNFGFEWTEFDRFGWDDDVYNKNFEKEVFHRKSLLEPEDLKNKLVLDAGCGNGRYSYWAAQYSKYTIGIDLGDGVESASKNLANYENVQIIQCDIFNPPFVDDCFDVIFSIGVLMHTGDAKKATETLMKKLKPQGSITVHLYGKGNFIYEFVNSTLRKKTTQMSIEELQTFTKKAYKFRRLAEKLKIAPIVNLCIQLDPHPHCIFDWYAAPIATHHSYLEVKKWFMVKNFKILKTNQSVIVLGPQIKTKNKIKLAVIRFLKKISFYFENIPVTVRGQKHDTDK